MPHRWHGHSMDSTYSSGRWYFSYQGLTLVSSCSQLPGAWLATVATPLFQGRPGRGNRLVVGPVAEITWGAGSTRSHSKSDGPRINLTQFQPGTPGRSLGGNALSDSFVSFSSLRKRPQRSASPLARGENPHLKNWRKSPQRQRDPTRSAGLHLRNWKKTSPSALRHKGFAFSPVWWYNVR